MGAINLILCTEIMIIWTCIGLTDAGQCDEGAKSAAQLLRNKIFCNYNPETRPTAFYNNYTDILMHMLLKFLIFDEHRMTLEVNCWMEFEWKDDFLKWDKSEFDDVDSLQVHSSDIWIPNVALFNPKERGDAGSKIEATQCNLFSSGQVLCVSPTTYAAYCVADFRRWPYDSHNCSVSLGSLLQYGDLINLKINGTGVTTSGYTENRDWELERMGSNVHQTKNYYNETENWVAYSFILRRHAGGRAAAVFIPALVLTLLTLCIFWMEPLAYERLFLISLNILCHCLYLQYLDMYLPPNGDNGFIILSFYRDSLLMAGMSLVITLVVRKINTFSDKSPSWIDTVVKEVLSYELGQTFLLIGVNRNIDSFDDDSEKTRDTELVQSTKGLNRWQLFAVFLDRASFLLYCFTFFILLCAYIPW